jgi:hypothetical protein
MLNKNTCEDIWSYILKELPNKTKLFNEIHNISTYYKGEYTYCNVKGIYYDDNSHSLYFIKDDDSQLPYNRVNSDVVRYITLKEFPNLKQQEVDKLQDTIVRLRTVSSNLDFCYNSLLGDIYRQSLNNIAYVIDNHIIDCLKEIMKYIK